jgi:hypothetical protein
MMKKILSMCAIATIALSPTLTQAQAPSVESSTPQVLDTPLPPPPVPPAAPLDGGLSLILLSGGIGYAYKRRNQG